MEVEPMPPVNTGNVKKLEIWDMDSVGNKQIIYKHPSESKTLVLIMGSPPINGEINLKIVKLIFDEVIPNGNIPIGTDIITIGGNVNYGKSIIMASFKKTGLKGNVIIYKIPNEFTAGIYGYKYSTGGEFKHLGSWFELEEEYLE